MRRRWREGLHESGRRSSGVGRGLGCALERVHFLFKLIAHGLLAPQGGAEAEGAEPAAHPDDEDGASAIPRAVKGKGKGRAAVRKLKKQLLEEYLHPGKAKKGAKDLPPSAGAAAPATKKTLDPRRDPLECQGCNMLFATRNQLFTHLKKTGHAAFK